jgi:transcriptional regulator with XRE-family HTH domain
MVQTNKGKFEITLANWLLKLREEKGLSQDALAVQLGKGQSDIAKIENGSKRITVFELLSWMIALDIPYGRLDEVLGPIYNSLANKEKIWNKQDEH